MEGLVHATFVENAADLMSPDTSEFVNLERQMGINLTENSPNFILGNSSRKTSEEVQRKIEADEEKRLQLQSELEEKLEERKRSMELSENGLQLMERRQFRQFSRADEYLYAMKEDLAEWMNNLYPHIDMDADTFMSKLETGEHLVQHANAVRQKCLDLLELIAEGATKQRPPNFGVPERELPCRFNVQPGTWFARDNVFNFILFCRRLGVMECIMFETEDLVCRKNEKHVILTLLEVARRGAKLGMLAPMLVQFEQEIDREIAREERQKRKEEKEEEKRRKEEERKAAELKRQKRAEIEAENVEKLLNNGLNFDSMQVEFDADDDLNMADVEDGNEDDLDEIEEDEELEIEDQDEDEEDDEDDFGYEMPIGPLPQTVTNDLKSLDEMVRELVSECQCPTQFPMIRISEGKYRVGDTQILIFVRILRNHVMVRVGGGWDTLQHYLDKHDPCRCRTGHKSASHAQITLKNGRNGPVAVGVCYDRTDSSPRRRSSTTNLNTLGLRRSSNNLTPNGSVMNINNKVIPSSRSSSTQQLHGSNKARALYAKQGSACLLMQNAQANSATLIPSPLTKTASKTSLGKSSLGSESGKSRNTKDTLSTCDSSSEVSDEGYKSSQGNVGNSASPNGVRTLTEEGQNIELASSNEERPESSLTVASECSSTISSEEEKPKEVVKSPPSPTNSSISGDEDDSGGGGDTWNTPTNQSTPIKDLSSISNVEKEPEKPSKSGRLASLFKIPKFKQKSEPPSLEATPSKKKETKPAFSRSNSMSSDTGSTFVRNTKERHSYRAPSATSRYMQAAEAYAAKSRASRSNSSTGTGTWSAATTGNGKNTWSGGSASHRSRSRPQLTSDTFRPPSRSGNFSRPASRTTSASPGPWRRRNQSGGSQNGFEEDLMPPSSTHSTPCKKPLKNAANKGETSKMSSSVGAKSQKTLADLDLEEEDAILKRMEEILLTYKSRVENHLAAEGRELPKEIFEDFTSQWVAASSNNTARPLSRSATGEIKVTPSPRKAKRDSSKTRIPVPTFYNSPHC